jgi:hypothetical protein
VTQFTRVLKVTYDGTAKDTGVVQKQSLAGEQPCRKPKPASLASQCYISM